jgi:predicted transcriptional regulator
VRLELLRHIVSGVRATAELAEIASLGTTGQLHHHLRQLVAAGWVRQSGRGAYEVPASRIVPLLACVTGAQR